MIVEDGTGVAGADAGISEAWFEAYCEARGITIPSGDVEAAIVRATAWIEGQYGSQFPGVPVNGRDQGLSFPATGAYDRRGYEIPSDSLPREYQQAIAEATLRELASAGSLLPDRTSAPQVRRKKLGSMEIEYAVADGGRAAYPDFPAIRGILAPLLTGSGDSGAMVTLLRA